MHVGASAICPHGGQISAITTNTRVFVDHQPVVTQNDFFTVLGCTFSLPSGPHPCILTKWIVPSTRLLVNGRPVVLQNSIGMCQSADQSPQGPPNVISTQTRVKGV
jgi:hypothetical protein